MATDSSNAPFSPKPIAFVRSGNITLVLNEAFARLLADDLQDAEDDNLFQLAQRIREQLEWRDRQRERFAQPRARRTTIADERRALRTGDDES